MRAGKDYFVRQGASYHPGNSWKWVKAAIRETGEKYMVSYSERLQVESAVYAGELIKQGAIGRVIQVLEWALTA